MLKQPPNEIRYLLTYVDSSFFSQHPCLLVLSAYLDPNSDKSYIKKREHCTSLADVNADGLPHGFEVARSFVGKCLSAHRAMWQPNRHKSLSPNGKRFRIISEPIQLLFVKTTKDEASWLRWFVVSKVNSMDSPNVFLICVFFPSNG